ncbi:hypothetical protein [Gallaecimonas sp. GXIMD4217]|uniref:hypothetical protein n=1 Tax=Gallaecimonas sp. GXIMD4217 TaxID=3131927 RepID=UPI00311B15E4
MKKTKFVAFLLGFFCVTAFAVELPDESQELLLVKNLPKNVSFNQERNFEQFKTLLFSGFDHSLDGYFHLGRTLAEKESSSYFKVTASYQDRMLKVCFPRQVEVNKMGFCDTLILRLPLEEQFGNGLAAFKKGFSSSKKTE